MLIRTISLAVALSTSATLASAGGLAPPIVDSTVEPPAAVTCTRWFVRCPERERHSRTDSDAPDDPITSAPDAPDDPVIDAPNQDWVERPRGDNSDANGKGGNRHDREDFTHGGTETAEDRKGVNP